MSSKTPLALMKETFGEKSKLVEALEKLSGEELWVARTSASKGLAHVSNAKLLRLHATFSEVKTKFGTREKLIDAILELEKRTKDAGYRQRLLAWPVPRLYDVYKSTAKRVEASKATPKAAAPKAAAPKEPAAEAKKPAAATKTAAATRSKKA
jgi:hypothetical protein